jgi:CrcB protein
VTELGRTLLVAAGGAIGAALRYLVTGWAQKLWGAVFPWGTAVVNIAGCFFIGFLMTLAIELSSLRPELRLFLVTGILGGLTTFSTFGHETMHFAQEGATLLALANLALNVIAGFLAVLAGTWTARML